MGDNLKPVHRYAVPERSVTNSPGLMHGWP